MEATYIGMAGGIPTSGQQVRSWHLSKFQALSQATALVAVAPAAVAVAGPVVVAVAAGQADHNIGLW